MVAGFVRYWHFTNVQDGSKWMEHLPVPSTATESLPNPAGAPNVKVATLPGIIGPNAHLQVVAAAAGRSDAIETMLDTVNRNAIPGDPNFERIPNLPGRSIRQASRSDDGGSMGAGPRFPKDQERR